MANDWAQIRAPIIPWGSLNATSQLARNLNIPSDLLPTLAILSGVSEAGPLLASLTPGGALRVAETGAGFSKVEVHEGTVENNTVTIQFTNLISSLVINIDTYQATIAHSEDGNTYDTPFTVLAGEKPAMDLLTRAIQITNNSASNTTGYRVWGLYYV